ncbi:hypothetical protein H6P81_005207 [Aristolochia fimbriata]|uniref:NADP-dependent oxidoreductase domain-containing protein n=1 Tax=Aristolochia fimbriata TaxID=158543 RepID=A0AAV7ETZ1_ARIFI|nr:hypothetical protein H6P81_005207 [Aristolochia fimbriata]
MTDRVRLSSSWELPLLGFGTALLPYNGDTVEKAIGVALDVGYRHFDTAKIYASEPAVGRALGSAIDEGKVEREDLFVTSKLWCADHDDPVMALRQTLQNLDMEYLDLYLVHWPAKLKPWVCYPVPNEDDFDELDMESTWAGMEKCVELGLCRSIGISNFSSAKIDHILEYASIPPAVNQVEMHPLWRQKKLRRFCQERGIHVSAYSPLGGPGNSWGSKAVVTHPVIKSIALKHRATPAQVALQWGMVHGSSVIVKSFNERRMNENMGALQLTLDEEDLMAVEFLEERKIMRGDFFVSEKGPYKTISDLWDEDIDCLN